ETSRGYHPDWRKAVFAALHQAGDLMPPTHLPGIAPSCAWFIAYCEEFLPARSDSFAQALPEVRRRIYDDWRRRAFQNWTAVLQRAEEVVLHPEAIPE